jgi:hypothetical protein
VCRLFPDYNLTVTLCIYTQLCLVTAVAELLDNAVDEVIKQLYCFISRFDYSWLNM